MPVGVGVYGTNGHQIQGLLAEHPRATLVAVAGMDLTALPAPLRTRSIRVCGSLEDLVHAPGVQLVSLCSPRRRDQARDAICCLEAGRHVYAEKPCAMSEWALDAIMSAVSRTGMQFHEMAGTAFGQPYLAMRGVVLSGVLGTVVQVIAQKSYPYHDGRPQDEDVDGGLIGQNGVHALRFVEHVACRRITDIRAVQTSLGNPHCGGLQMAASLMMQLDNGGVASVVANYLNQRGLGSWGNEMLRIFGTQGFVEAVDGGTRTRLVIGDRDMGPLDTTAPGLEFFDCFIDSLVGLGTMPLSLEEELHPTRMALRARESAMRDRLARADWTSRSMS